MLVPVRKLIPVPLFILISLFISGCGGSGFIDVSSLKSELNLAEIPGQKEYPNADAIRILERHETQLTLTADGYVTTEEKIHIIEKLLKNIESRAFVEIELGSGQKLEKIFARTVKNDGTVVELKPEDFLLTSGSSDNTSFYTDGKSVKFTFPAIEKNCIVEYVYTVKKDFAFRYDIWFTQNTVPILKNEYILRFPKLLVLARGLGGAGWNWNYQPYNLSLPKPVTDEGIKNQDLAQPMSITWTLRNVDAFDPEPNMPAWTNYIGHMRFAPSDWESWDDISSWYYNKLFEPQVETSSKIKQLAESLTKGLSSDEEKIEALNRYVRNIRYVSIVLGDGGLTPNPPSKVIERNYGDCKDKSTLLLSLCRAIGIKTNPVLVLTSDRGEIDENFTSWRFNHMIVHTTTGAGKSYFIDPTAEFAILNDLPASVEGIKMMVIDQDGKARFQKSPSSASKDNLTSYNCDMIVEADGSAKIDVTITYTGKEAQSARYELKDLTNDELIRHCRAYIVEEFINSGISNISHTPVDSVYMPMKLQFTVTLPSVLTKAGDLSLAAVNPFKIFHRYGWLNRDKRFYPLQFPYRFTVEKNINIQLPEKYYTVRSVPEKLSLSSGTMGYTSQYEDLGGGKIHSKETFILREARLLPKDYPDFRKNVEKLKNKSEEKLVLSKK